MDFFKSKSEGPKQDTPEARRAAFFAFAAQYSRHGMSIVESNPRKDADPR